MLGSERSQRAIATTALTLLLLGMAGAGQAADDLERTRVGFSPGMMFSLSTGLSSLPEDQQVLGGSIGLGIGFELGGFLTDQVSLHWSGHGQYLFADESAAVAALSGPRVTYYLKRSAPCWYASATLGSCSTYVLSGSTDHAITGVGACAAIGYELKPQGAVELGVYVGMEDPGDPHDGIDRRGSLVLVSLGVGSAGYRHGS